VATILDQKRFQARKNTEGGRKRRNLTEKTYWEGKLSSRGERDLTKCPLREKKKKRKRRKIQTNEGGPRENKMGRVGNRSRWLPPAEKRSTRRDQRKNMEKKKTGREQKKVGETTKIHAHTTPKKKNRCPGKMNLKMTERRRGSVGTSPNSQRVHRTSQEVPPGGCVVKQEKHQNHMFHQKDKRTARMTPKKNRQK